MHNILCSMLYIIFLQNANLDLFTCFAKVAFCIFTKLHAITAYCWDINPIKIYFQKYFRLDSTSDIVHVKTKKNIEIK